MYGDADRITAKLFGEVNGGMAVCAYDDLWSYNIKEKRWKKQIIGGLPPCARSEMGAVFNPILDKTFFFGGYSPTLPSCPQENPSSQSHFKNVGKTSDLDSFGFSYFADTFLSKAARRTISESF
ncbi:hypothetical protein DL96DRAFT_1713223 [Flagelloscypha sp. PMI_526]|nr:hypothetical protein DL96DRAFT_1713223 [Flagelloscypha sp. PMI_526]